MSDDIKENKKEETPLEKAKKHPLLKGWAARKGKATPEIKVPEGMSGFVVLKFKEQWNDRKPGSEETYHVSTAKSLVHLGVAEVKEHIKIYVPKKAKE